MGTGFHLGAGETNAPRILYHSVAARSFRPLWALEELGLGYELVVMPFPPRAHVKDYKSLNPLGTVPLFLEGLTRMTESSAICEYLAARHPEAGVGVAIDDPAYGEYLNFCHFGEATLTFPQTLVLRYGRFEPAERRQPQVAADYAAWFLARLRTLEPRLAEHEYVAAGRFTAADISVGYALLLAGHLGLAAEFTPAVTAYWARLQRRAAYRAALEAERTAAIAQGVDPRASTEV
ncbi:MAG: glutathione S-transferase family protein [Gammaproteobacteria bacterium]|nr:glutathione S-transferase family protein [Gammaproteobacteria bacterium]MBI5615070.1 glutathione S-transferase family protein [Gammaproteobacteria bacterium]